MRPPIASRSNRDLELSYRSPDSTGTLFHRISRTTPEQQSYEAMDTVTKVLIETIGNTGYVVSITYDDARPVVTAVDERTREVFIVRHEDLYHAACELAEQIGIDLDDS